MQMNQDYDLTRPLATALKLKAPYVGIPMPGHAPLTFDRKRLAACLKGVKPIHLEVFNSEAMETVLIGNGYTSKGIQSNVRFLRVEGIANGGRVRTKLTVRAIPASYWRSRQGKDTLSEWRNSEQRARIRKALSPTLDRKAAATARKAEDTLKRLRRELEKLGRPHVLYNPTVPCVRGIASDGERKSFADERRTRRMRTVVGAIAAQAKRESWTSVYLYKHLAARGLTFDKLSDLKGTEREMYGAVVFRDYLTHLHRFIHGTGCWHQRESFFRRLYGRTDYTDWTPERYMRKLADIQTRRSLEEQISSVEAILLEAKGAPK